jgi:O-antigen/teichoic acid export membrane protein
MSGRGGPGREGRGERRGRGFASAAVARAVQAGAARLGWGLADQAVSSLTNFAVGVFVARSLGAAAFGVFSLAWVTYAVVLNLSRGLATDPLVVRFSGTAVAAWRAAVSRSSGTALLIGFAGAAVCLVAGLALGNPVGPGFVALGLVLPALLLQDSWRYAFFAASQGRKAFINDLVWGVALVPAMFLAVETGSVFGFVLAWGAAGGVAAAVGFLQTGVRPCPSGTRGWLTRHRDLGARYMVENLSNSFSGQLRMYGLGAIAGLAAVGAIRGAVLLLGPFLAILMGLSLVAVPEGVRMLRRSPRHLARFCLALGGAQAAAALCWGLLLLLLLPDAVGHLVLGAVWAPASALILPVTLEVAAAGLSTGAAAGLRALGAAPRSLRTQLLSSAGYLTCGLGGAAVAGAAGSAWGVAVSVSLSSGIWWSQLRAGLRDHAAPALLPAASQATADDV